MPSRPNLIRRCGRLAAWSAAFVLVARVGSADQIELSDGKSISGKIQRESAAEVVLESASGTQTISVGRIVQVRYDGQGAMMTRGKIREEAYDLSRAAEDYTAAQSELAGRPLILLAARFGELRVRTLLALDASEPLDPLDPLLGSLEEFARLHPDSRHYYPCQRLLGRLYLAKSDYAKATAAFDALGKAPWPEARWAAAVDHARIHLAQQRPDAALESLEPVLSATPQSKEARAIQAEAWLEKSDCHRQRGDRAEEIAALDRVIERAPQDAAWLEPQAYAALGDAYRAAGRTKEALAAFLHIDLLFANKKDVHARALYNLSQVWNELGRPDRANQAQSTLTTEYPDSSWTKKLAK